MKRFYTNSVQKTLISKFSKKKDSVLTNLTDKDLGSFSTDLEAPVAAQRLNLASLIKERFVDVKHL